MVDRESKDADDFARLNRLVDEGHEDAERHGAISAEDLDRMLADAKVKRLGTRKSVPSVKPGVQSRRR